MAAEEPADPELTAALRALCEALAAGREPALPSGGLGLLLERAGRTAREAVPHLAERWFGPAPALAEGETWPPPLNDEHLGENAKLAAVLVHHCGRSRPWMALSTNESTFYRYRRAAVAALAGRCWTAIRQRPLATNLPWPDYVHFVGRKNELRELVRHLANGPGAVVGIEGPGGTGKTALALAVARLCLDAAHDWRPISLDGALSVPLFDAVIWAGSRYGRLGLGDLLDLLARTLDYPGLLGREQAGRRAALRDLLARRATLIVVDDADRAEPALTSFLLELPVPSRALVTSRHRLPPRITAVPMTPLSIEENVALLRQEGRRQTVDLLDRAPDAALVPLAAATRRFPLLTVWSAGQLRQGQSIERVQTRLAGGDSSALEEMFAGSVELLSDAASRVLRVLPLFVAPAAREAVVAATERSAADAGVDELIEASLLESTEGLLEAERRYTLHAIPRAFVRRHLALTDRERRRAVLAGVSHYRELTARFAGSARRWAQLDRVEVEIENILALSEAAWQEAILSDSDPPAAAFDEAVVALAHELRNFFWLRHYWREGLEFFQRAREAAHRLDDRRGEGWNTYRLAYLHFELGTAGYREAWQRAMEAVDVLRAAGDLRGTGHALRLLGRAARERGEFETAWRTLEEARELLARHGAGDDLAIVRASQADLLRRQGSLDAAAALYLEALRAPLGDPGTRATVLQQLGDVRLRQVDLEAARHLFEQGERVAADAGVRGIVAACRWGRAEVARRQSDERLAATLQAEAAELFERLGELLPFDGT